MEEKLSDNICKDAFREFYVKKDYKQSLAKSVRIYRLMTKINEQDLDYKDNFYMWMILMIIIKSYKQLNQIEKSFPYIMLSLRYSKEEYKKCEDYRNLIEYYSKVGNVPKCLYYLNIYRICCIKLGKIGKYQTILKILGDIEINV